MARILFIAALSSLLLSACAGDKFLPKEVRHLEWEMSEDALKEKATVTLDASEWYRNVYIQEVNEGDVQRIIYYFNKNRLYEVITQYQTEELAREKALKTYGKPNHDDEWRFTADGVQYGAWVFQNKVVAVKCISGSEWESGFED